jgi:hypothetical protein
VGVRSQGVPETAPSRPQDGRRRRRVREDGLLHFRRAFVEKLFAIHSKVQIFTAEGRPVGSYARHYYDLFELSSRPEVPAMLRSDEYAVIKTDYDAVSRAHFAKSCFAPAGMSFAASDALFPKDGLARALGAEYGLFADLSTEI